MNWLVEDFAFAAAVISEAQLSGLAFGFFASLLAMMMPNRIPTSINFMPFIIVKLGVV